MRIGGGGRTFPWGIPQTTLTAKEVGQTFADAVVVAGTKSSNSHSQQQVFKFIKL